MLNLIPLKGINNNLLASNGSLTSVINNEYIQAIAFKLLRFWHFVFEMRKAWLGKTRVMQGSCKSQDHADAGLSRAHVVRSISKSYEFPQKRDQLNVHVGSFIIPIAKHLPNAPRFRVLVTSCAYGRLTRYSPFDSIWLYNFPSPVFYYLILVLIGSSK